MSRSFDVVLFGATGFTGKLVAEYLAGKDLTWAIAGRNRDKLEKVRRDLSLGDLPILVADGHDAASLEALVPKTRVVATTVGPYNEHGRLLATTCARHGTHYCDITGEVPFIRASIDANHEEAVATRARVVHCCGFDSIPFDLGVHMLWDRAHQGGHHLAWAKGFAAKLKGGFSGGTVASMLALAKEAGRDREVRRLLGNPYALDPDPRVQGPPSPDQHGVRKDEDLGRWTAPFVMAAINTRVVRRSNAILDYAYGKDFRYSEAMSFAPGPKGLFGASMVTGGLVGFLAAAAFPPTRELLARAFLPKPGEGPSKEERERGFFEVKILAETDHGERLSGRVAGKSDPGYGETAKMLGESALCLAKDDALLPARYGVLTPASSMGMHLVDRLRRAGMTFEVDPS
ncbi:MAG: saccharopine dehydrogenase NADP-binding domain-containing protein [Labilithrix sp.]|nr:saccharopine dehydrogenase NADP-binding domain-containing protein [Labilithrix sp.]